MSTTSGRVLMDKLQKPIAYGLFSVLIITSLIMYGIFFSTNIDFSRSNESLVGVIFMVIIGIFLFGFWGSIYNRNLSVVSESYIFGLIILVLYFVLTFLHLVMTKECNYKNCCSSSRNNLSGDVISSNYVPQWCIQSNNILYRNTALGLGLATMIPILFMHKWN
jgi:hypothetical protein